jgi:hypothetical protein
VEDVGEVTPAGAAAARPAPPQGRREERHPQLPDPKKAALPAIISPAAPEPQAGRGGRPVVRVVGRARGVRESAGD